MPNWPPRGYTGDEMPPNPFDVLDARLEEQRAAMALRARGGFEGDDTPKATAPLHAFRFGEILYAHDYAALRPTSAKNENILRVEVALVRPFGGVDVYTVRVVDTVPPRLLAYVETSLFRSPRAVRLWRLETYLAAARRELAALEVLLAPMKARGPEEQDHIDHALRSITGPRYGRYIGQSSRLRKEIEGITRDIRREKRHEEKEVARSTKAELGFFHGQRAHGFGFCFCF